MFKRSRFLLFAALLILLGAQTTIHAVPLLGTVTASNSIIGAFASDTLGNDAITELPNGNIVIKDIDWNGGRGAVTCLTPAQYRAGGIVIDASNSLVGAAAGDQVGMNVEVLATGDYVVASEYWDNGGTINAGAVTWVDGDTCIPFGESTRGAVVSVSNSLVGSTGFDQLGNYGVTALPNGAYLVSSPSWDNGVVADAGAVTFVPAGGMTGTVTLVNSLYGVSNGDQIGGGLFSGVFALPNGNYVVVSPEWDNGGTANVGAITLGNGMSGTSGMVLAGNSMIGSTAGDRVGSGGVNILTNGNYVIRSFEWDNGALVDAGAVTWISSSASIGGTVVSAANSLVGSTSGDQIGISGLWELPNGNYVFRSPDWDFGAVADAGAVTWVNGTTGLPVGFVSPVGSLVGSTANDRIGSSVTVLDSGHYVVASPDWDNGGIQNVGAATWVNGTTGSPEGVITVSNSLLGSTAGDGVGSRIIGLTNGNYLMAAGEWDNGAIANAGAVTWGNGSSGTVGLVSEANSLVGSSDGDRVGDAPPTPLTNGNYVVRTYSWDNGGIQDVGAVTWGNGFGGTVGAVNPANSLVGTLAFDAVGNGSVKALTNGNYVVASYYWKNEGVFDTGAVTLGNGNGGTVGAISPLNSLVGTDVGDLVGLVVISLPNGNYVVHSSSWDGGGTVTGAVTWGDGVLGITGPVSASNSLIGAASGSIVTELPNGNYVVRASSWSGTGANRGAVTVGNGKTGTTGTISAANSMIGSSDDDQISSFGMKTLNSGGFLVRSPSWDNGATADVGAITYSDSFLAGVTITESSGTTVSEDGTTDTYSVVLDAVPTSNVTVNLGFGQEITVNGQPLTFTSTDWNIPQIVTIAAENDLQVEGVDTANITHSVTSIDPAYAALTTLPSVPVAITDNDIATLSFASGGGSAVEGVTPYSVNVVLDITTSPAGVGSMENPLTAQIIDTAGTALSGDYNLSTTSLLFAAGATDAAMLNVDVTILDDAITESDEAFTLTLGTVTGNATASAAPHIVTITDNDPASIEIISNGGFENHLNKPSQPDGWIPAGNTQDRLKCNTDTVIFSRTGDCAYRFVGGEGENSRLTQSRRDVTTLTTGMTINTTFYYRTNNVKPRLKIKLVVFYKNSTLVGSRKDTINLISAGEYEVYSLQPYTIENGTVAKLKFQFQNRAVAGKIYIDDLSVTHSATRK